jgi:hypothetical protein
VGKDRSLVLHAELKGEWKKETRIEIRSHETRRGVGWWVAGIWRLKCDGNIDQWLFPACRVRRIVAIKKRQNIQLYLSN